MPRKHGVFLALVIAAAMLAMPAAAHNTPLSGQAVREAYFLGKRGGESVARLLSSYTKYPAPAATGHHGAHVSSVSFLTPFALIAQYSSRQSDYSAQQAERDHNPDKEVVSIEIRIAASKYDWPSGANSGGVRSGGPYDYYPQSYGFWKTFQYRVFNGKQEVTTKDIIVEPQYDCGGDSGCGLAGVSVRLQFPATAFTAESATIKVIPPEDETVSLDFDLSVLR
jgi:hypothetical protein